MSAISIATTSERATQAFAAALAKQCRTGDCILLEGDLGAGKTTFARGFIGALYDGDDDIVSPTFTLVQQYGIIRHFDLYRLKSPDDLQEIGLSEALQDAITLIEWPALAADYIPASALTITIAFGKNTGERQWTLSGDATWHTRLAALEKANYT